MVMFSPKLTLFDFELLLFQQLFLPNSLLISFSPQLVKADSSPPESGSDFILLESFSTSGLLWKNVGLFFDRANHFEVQLDAV